MTWLLVQRSIAFLKFYVDAFYFLQKSEFVSWIYVHLQSASDENVDNIPKYTNFVFVLTFSIYTLLKLNVGGLQWQVWTYDDNRNLLYLGKLKTFPGST